MELRELKDRAERHVGRREYRKAERLFLTLLEREPRDARLHLRYGEMMRRLGDDVLAARSFARAAVQLAGEGHAAQAKAAKRLAQQLDPSLSISLPPVQVDDGARGYQRARAIDMALEDDAGVDIELESPAETAAPAASASAAAAATDPDLMEEAAFESIYCQH